MKYITLLGLFSFLAGGCISIDGVSILSGILFIGGLLTVYISQQFWDWEDII